MQSGKNQTEFSRSVKVLGQEEEKKMIWYSGSATACGALRVLVPVDSTVGDTMLKRY
jgi:hypothetical protein